MKSTLLGQVTHLYPDPSTLPFIPRGAFISTLRLSSVQEFAQWTIIQDVKNSSFLSGFSKVDGLWTFLSGIFTAIFGSSLVRVLLGLFFYFYADRNEADCICKNNFLNSRKQTYLYVWIRSLVGARHDWQGISC